MAIPAAKVETRIVLETDDRASKGIKDAHGALRDFGHEAEGVGGQFHEMGEKAAGALSSTSRLARPLAGFAGEAGGEVRELGHAMHGFALATELIPGPLGMVAGGVVALGVAAVLTNQHMEKLAAQNRLLNTPLSQNLRGELDLDAEGARKAAEAMEGLRSHTALNNTILKEVIANAKSLGEEPAKAVEDLAKAWAGGVVGVLAYQAAHGRMAGLDRESLDATAERLGLDREALGLADKQLTLGQQLNDQTLAAAKARHSVDVDIAAVNDALYKSIHGYTDEAKRAGKEQYAALLERLGPESQLTEEADRQVKYTQQTLTFNKEQAAEEKARSEDQKLANLQAELAGTKAEQRQLKLASIGEQQAEVAKKLATLEELRAVIGGGLTDDQKRQLEILKAQLEVETKAIHEADNSEKKAAHKKAAEDAKKRQTESAKERTDYQKAIGEVESQQMLAAAGNDAMKLAKVQEQNLIAAANREETAIHFSLDSARVKAAKFEAIEGKLDQDLANLHREATDQELTTAQERDDALAQLEMARLAEKKKHLLAEDDLNGAHAIDVQIADLDLHQKQIEEERRFATEMLSAKSDQAKAEIQQAHEHNLELLKLNGANKNGSDKNGTENAARGYASLEAAANAANAAGTKGAQAVGNLAKHSAQLNKDWEQTKKAGGGIVDMAPGMVEAAGSIAAGFVDGEKSKAGIMAITEFAAGWASYPNPVGMASHFTAAAIYGSIAGGIIGGGGSSAPGGGGGSGGSSPFSPSGGSAGQGGHTINVIYGVLGTKQQQGLAIQQAIAATRGTGFSGKGV